jgi:hypothetical protein
MLLFRLYIRDSSCLGARRRTFMHSAPLGGSTSRRLCMRKLTLKTCDFIDICNALASDTAIPTTLGGLTITLPPIVAVILQHQLAYLYDLRKLSVFLLRVNSCFYFCQTRYSGAALCKLTLQIIKIQCSIMLSAILRHVECNIADSGPLC